MLVTCTRCGHNQPLPKGEVHPCRHHGEPSHKCELLCPECVNAEIEWHNQRGAPAADLRKEMRL